MSLHAIKVTYVEDDINLGMVVKDFLEMQSYKVQHFVSAEEMIKQEDSLTTDICILDIMLPGMDGYELAKYIRKQDSNIPIIFLSAKDQVQDKIEGLKLGADDYISKPFSTIELDLRIQNIIKRSTNAISSPTTLDIQLGNFRYKESELQISFPDITINLTKKENQLLSLFINNRDTIIKRDDILQRIWGSNNHQSSRSMDVYLSKLRKIFVHEPRIEIINYHGTGFKFDTSKLENQ